MVKRYYVVPEYHTGRDAFGWCTQYCEAPKAPLVFYTDYKEDIIRAIKLTLERTSCPGLDEDCSKAFTMGCEKCIFEAVLKDMGIKENMGSSTEAGNNMKKSILGECWKDAQ